MNDDGLALLQTQCVVNPVQRRQAGDRDRTGVPQIQAPRDRRGLVGGHRYIFRVKAALRVLPVVRIDFVTDLQPPHPRADRGDDAGALEAENHGEMRFAAGKKSFPDVSVPSANARGIDGDQYFTGINCRYRQGVRSDHLGSTKTVDSRGEHGAGHMHRVMSWSNNMAGTIEHDGTPAGLLSP